MIPCYPVYQGQNTAFIQRITAQEAEILRSWVPDFQFGTWEYCTYCGDIPATRDHVIPFSMLFPGDTDGRGIKTPACGNCNGLLSNLYFSTFQARVYFVVMRLKTRHKKLLNLPNWSPKDLEEMSPEMQGFIFRSRRQRQNIIERLEWHQGIKFMAILTEAVQDARQRFPHNTHLHNFLTLEL